MFGEHEAKARSSHTNQRAVHKRRILVTVKHVGVHLACRGRKSPGQRWMEAWLAPEDGDGRAVSTERVAPGASLIETTHRLPRLARESLDQFQHEPFSAAGIEREDDLQD